MNSVMIAMNTVMSLATMWIVYKYLNLFFQKRKAHSLFHIGSWILFFAFQFWVESNKGTGSLTVLLINIILLLFIAAIGYLGTIRKKILFVGLLHVVWMLIEILISFMLRTLEMGNIEFGILGSTISKIGMFALVGILNTKLWKSKNISMGYAVMLLLIPASSVFIAYYIFLLSYDNNGKTIFSMLSFTLLLIINITIFEVYEKLSASLEVQRENAIFDQQIELLSKHTEEQKKTMEEYKETQHDLIQQYIGLKSNIECNRKDKALEILESLLKNGTIQLEKIADSGNDIIDSLLNYKYSVAKKSNIDFRVKIFVPEELPIKQKDLCVILGNALDNAIEATKKCDVDKLIDIAVGVKKEAFVMVIKNPYREKITTDEWGNITTSKEDKGRHGFGLNSMKKAVERNQGEMVMETKDGIFSLTIIMNL
ncbi:MAG: GHKL domain-containing protein [Lachnospiraceae bacterium]